MAEKISIYDFLKGCSREILVVHEQTLITKQDREQRKPFRSEHNINGQSESELHHIIPTALGGKDERKNYACVEKRLHVEIHKFIEAQGEFPVGEERLIQIPVLEGKVWTFPEYVDVPVPGEPILLKRQVPQFGRSPA